MVMDVQNKVTQLRNEVKAQKVYSGLTYSQLLLPENTPTQSYSGNIDLSRSGEPIARVRFRFTRTDGLLEPPLINFTHTSSYSPSYRDYAQSNGFSFSPTVDMSYFDTQNIEAYIGGVGDGYVDFYIDYKTSIRTLFFSLNSVQISTTCQAISNVYGQLTVERVK